MALKHKLARFACVWAGHDSVPGTVKVYGDLYYCECCSRCLKVLARDSLPLSTRLRHMEFARPQRQRGSTVG